MSRSFKSASETTTTANVPIWFPPKQRKKEGSKMNEASVAIRLVEHGLTSEQALQCVVEGDAEKAAKLMAAAATDDPEKKKELEAKYSEKFKKMMASDADKDDKDEADDDKDDKEKDDKEKNDKKESRRKR